MTEWASWSPGNCAKNWSWLYEQIVQVKPRICTGGWHTQNLWDYAIETDHQISAGRPDLIIFNKKERTCRIVGFAIPADHRVKSKKAKRGMGTATFPGNWKPVEYESNDYINWCPWYIHERIGTRTGRLRNNGTGEDCPKLQHYWDRLE